MNASESKIENNAIPIESGHLQALANGVANAEVQDHIRLAMTLMRPGEIIEVRVKDRRGNVLVGYYDDVNRLAVDVQLASECGQAKAVWFCINEVDPSLSRRSLNKIISDKGCSEKDIVRYRHLMIDFDPKRPSETSSSATELEKAIERATTARDFLREKGWPEPLFASSGNGAHLMYRLDIPYKHDGTDEEKRAKVLVDAFHRWAAKKWGGGGIGWDSSVIKPGQLGRVYGTWNRKGDPVPDAPHRLSRILEAPEALKPVPEMLLKFIVNAEDGVMDCNSNDDQGGKTATSQVVADAIRERERIDGKTSPSGQYWNLERVREYVTDKGLEIKAEKREGDGVKLILAECPFESSHTADVFVRDDGRPGFHCFHATCKGKIDEHPSGWKAFRAKIGEPSFAKAKSLPEGKQSVNAKSAPVRRWLTGDEIEALPDPEWLVKGHMLANTTATLIGPPGAGKSFFALELALAVAEGKPLFDQFRTRKGPVGYVYSEGDTGAKLRLRAWSQHHQRSVPRDFRAGFHRYDFLKPEEAENIIAGLREAFGEMPKLVTIDTLARNFMGDENSAKDMGLFVQSVDMIRDAGASVLVVAHTGKDAGRGSRGSTALPGAVDSILVASKIENGLTINQEKMKDGGSPLKPYSLTFKSFIVGHNAKENEPMESAALEWQGYDTAESKEKSEDRAAVERLGITPDGITVAEAQKKWNLTTGPTRNRLDTYVQKGLLRRVDGCRNPPRPAVYFADSVVCLAALGVDVCQTTDHLT